METHCSRASGAGLARYRDGHSREGGAQSGLLEARMPRARGAGGEGTPGTASGRGGPASAQPPFSLSLPLPTLGPVPAPSLTQTRILVGSLHGARHCAGKETHERRSHRPTCVPERGLGDCLEGVDEQMGAHRCGCQGEPPLGKATEAVRGACPCANGCVCT